MSGQGTAIPSGRALSSDSAPPTSRRPARLRAEGLRGPAPIRVLFVKDRLHETGGTLYYLQTLPGLDPARVTPLLCAFAPRHPIAERFEAIGIKPTFFGRTRWDPRCLIDLVRFARSCRADLLHLEGATSFAFGRLGARAVGLPSVLHFHCMLPMPLAQALANRRLMSPRWRGIAVSEAVRQWSIREFGIGPERIGVLYSGHDVDRFGSPPAGARDRIRSEFGLADDAPVVGLVGRIDIAQKGQDVMIRALPALRERCPGLALLLVGDGPDRAKCEALAKQLGLGDAVRFCGHRSDIPDLLAAVDVVAVPSVCDEGLPLVVIEASAAARPIVAFDGGGLPEGVVHGDTGFIVRKGDAAGFTAAIARIFADPGLAERMGGNGRAHATRFAMSRHVERLMALYEEVLAAQQRHGLERSRKWREELTP